MKNITYQILIENSVYYGSTQDGNLRFSQHRNALKRGDHINPHLQRKFNKHGESALQFIVLGTFRTLEEARNAEQKLLNNNYENPLCMNIARNAHGGAYPMTDEVREKMSLSAKLRERLPLSEEHKQKISEAKRGHEVSQCTRKKISSTLKDTYEKMRNSGENPNNRRFTPEQVRAIRNRYKQGGISMTVLAKEYKVAKQTISNIVNYINYREV